MINNLSNLIKRIHIIEAYYTGDGHGQCQVSQESCGRIDILDEIREKCEWQSECLVESVSHNIPDCSIALAPATKRYTEIRWECRCGQGLIKNPDGLCVEGTECPIDFPYGIIFLFFNQAFFLF